MLIYSSNLKSFKDKGNSVYNFRCSECGDSDKNKHKARGYIYEKGGKYFYYCHNCQYSVSFENYLKQKDYNLYSEFIREKFDLSPQQLIQKFSKTIKTIVDIPSEDIIKNEKILTSLPSLQSLGKEHDAVKYLLKRKIPCKFFDDLYLTDDFKIFTNSLVKDKFEIKPDHIPEERIIIPIRGKDNVFVGFQGRSLSSDPNAIRYITIMIDKSKPRIFGLNKVRFNYRHYVLEGPFDSMFVENAVATAGGAILSELDKLGTQKENTTIIFDNEPRNKQICDQLHKAITRNFDVFIWPDHIKSKDINDLVLSGEIGDANLVDFIDSYVYNGLTAELEFRAWKKC